MTMAKLDCVRVSLSEISQLPPFDLRPPSDCAITLAQAILPIKTWQTVLFPFRLHMLTLPDNTHTIRQQTVCVTFLFCSCACSLSTSKVVIALMSGVGLY